MGGQEYPLIFSLESTSAFAVKMVQVGLLIMYLEILLADVTLM